MSSTDRNQKLKNYHARKVRERQHQQKLHKENLENPSSTVVPLTALNHQSKVSTGGPIMRHEGHSYKQPAGTTLKSFKSRSSRSLFATTTTTGGNNYSTERGGGNKFTIPKDNGGISTRATPSSSSLVAGMTIDTTTTGGSSVNLNSRDSVVSSLQLSTSTTKSNVASTKLNQIPPSSGASKLDKIGSNTPKVSHSQGGNSSENSTMTTNNSSAAAKMFAARRRRAQLEMSSGDSSSVGSVGGSVIVGSGGVALLANAGEKSSTASLNVGKSSRGNVESVKRSSSSVSGGSSSSFNRGGSGGGGGGGVRISSSSSSLATRKAYERYSGNSSGGSVSSFDGGSSIRHHRGGGTTTHSGKGRSRPSSAPVATTTSNNTGSHAMNGINSMNSMDSTDNSTIATAPSVDYGDRTSTSSPSLSNIVGRTIKVGNDTAKRAGQLESLSTIREVSGTSFSSMSTIQVSNVQQKSEEVESIDAKDDSSHDADGDNKSGPTPILRQPHLHEIKAVTKDEDDGQSKLVRFDLSPLMRGREVDDGVASVKVVGGVAQHDDVITSDSVLPASTTLTSLSSADTIQSDNGGDEAPSSGQKASPSSMDEFKADDNTPPISDEASQNTDAAAEEEEYDEEFATFINGLRQEVAGDHTKLWSEFQSIMGRPPQEHVPLNLPSHNVNSDADPKKKKEKIQFDPQTTKTLNAIYKHFHEENQRVISSSRRFLRKKSQLKNDKDIVRQQREEKRVAAEAAAARGETARVDEDSKGWRNSESNVHPHQSGSNLTSSSGKNELAAVKLRPASSRSSTNDEPANLSTPKNELASVKLRPTPPPANTSKSFTTLTPQKSFSVGVSTKVSKVLQRSGSESSNGSGRSISPRDEKEKKSSTNWMDALKMKQKLIRMKQMSGSNNVPLQVETGGSLDASGMTVSPRKKLRISPPSSPEEKEGQVPPWAKVQLRATQRREELLSDTPTSSVYHSTPKSFSPTPSSQSTKGTTADSLPSLCCVGDMIDLDSLPNRLFPEEAATVFPLKKKNADNGPQHFVIVGTIAIVTASGTAGSEGRKVKISWWCRRSTIRTLTLNVEATGATLAHASGRMPLVFDSSDVCLDFAQAFYRGPSKPVPTASSPPQQPLAQEEVSEDFTKLENGENEESSGQNGDGNIKTVLTKAEECLVAEHRQYGETEKSKLRLICLSPKGEEVVEVTVPDMRNVNNDVTGEVTSEKKECSGSGLTKEEEKSVSSYKKMLAVGLPPDVVRHKMTLEGVQASVVAAVLGADESVTEAEAKKEGDVADPRKALLNAIKKKGNEEVDSTNPVSTDPKNALLAAIKGRGVETSKPILSDEEDRIASKYRRMLKMGIPLDAVKHSMKKEGVDSKIASAVAEEASSDVAATAPVTPAKPKSKIGSTAGPALSEEEEKIASKYRRMLKFCIPKDTVRHDMKKEGVSQKIVEAILGKDDAVDNGNNMETPAKGKNTKTKGIHWTANNLSQDLLEGSIFARSATKKRKLPLIYPEEADIKKLEELFRKNDNKHTGKVKSGETNAGNEMAKLLDITRANNIAIQLKAFNDFTLRALAETINDLDPDSKIIGERVQFIPQLLPTPKELQAIKKYKGESDKLNTAELFFQQLLPVKRAEDKVAVVKAMCTFNEHAEEARAGFKTLEEVCGQVMNSSKLEQILLMVLNIGNLMNEGSLDGGVEAFKFESLPKLSQTKSADGKTTVLDYIVETFIEKGARDTLLLNSDFPDIQESCRLSLNDLCGDVNTLRKNYQLCKTELNSMKKDQTPKPAKGTQRKKIEGEAADPRKALFAAIQSRGTNDDDSSPKPTPVDPRQARFAAIKNKGADASTASTPGANVKYSRGVKRLESFIWKAEASLSLTERDQSAALRACKGLAVYCGEEGGERSASALLQILSAFASSLRVAVEKYDKRAELSKRQKTPSKRVPQKKDKENQVNAMPEKKQLLKASSLQPHVGLTDRVKRVSAGADPNTSSLATVANSRRSPKTRHKQTSSNDGDARSAMFAAIKSRNQEPVGVTNKVRTINTNVKQRESRIHMVHKMLKEAPPNVKDDFIRGVTYRETYDPLLQKIYQKEGVTVDDTPDELKPVDPRQELFSAIKSRRQE